MMSRVYNVVIYAGMTMLLVFAPLARGATVNRVWAITPVMLVIYTIVFAWVMRGVNGKSNAPRFFASLRMTEASPQNDRMAALRMTGASPQNGKEKIGADHALTSFAWVCPYFFIVMAGVSFIFSIYKYDSFYALLRLLGYIGLFWVLANSSRRLMKYLIGLIVCVGIGISVYGLLQYFGVLAHDWWYPADFLAGPYVNHNHFAGYLEMVIPVAIGMLIKIILMEIHRNKLKFIEIYGNLLIKIGLILAIIAMLVAFVFAQSRGGWISLGIALFVMNIVLIKRKVFRVYSIFLLLALALGVFFYFYHSEGLVSKRIETMIAAEQQEASMKTRFEIWQGTIKMIADNPWSGVGIGCFEWAFPRYRSEALGRARIRPRYAHNDYLHVAAEMGIPALIALICIFIFILNKGFSKTKDPVALGCTIGALSLMLHGMVDFNFHIPANVIVFIVCVAYIVGSRGKT